MISSNDPYGSPSVSELSAVEQTVPRHTIYAPIAFGAVASPVCFVLATSVWNNRDAILSGKVRLEYVISDAVFVGAFTLVTVVVVTGLVLIAACAVAAMSSPKRTYWQAVVIGVGGAFPFMFHPDMSLPTALFFMAMTVGGALSGAHWAIFRSGNCNSHSESVPTPDESDT